MSTEGEWTAPRSPCEPPAAVSVRAKVRGLAVAGILGCGCGLMLVAGSARSDDGSPGLATLPSFLGADSLKALEAARAEREAEAAQQPSAQPVTAAPAAKNRKAQDEEAKRRADTVRRLVPGDGGVKRLSPDEMRLLEAEDAAKARADQRAKETGAPPARAAAVTTIEEKPAAPPAVGASAAALGAAAAEVKALLADPAPAAPAGAQHNISLMEKVPPAPEPAPVQPAPAEAKPAEPVTPPPPPVAAPARSGSGKLTAPLPSEPQAAQPAIASCGEVVVKTSPLAGGRMGLELDSGCRANETVSIRYGAVTFERALDKAGRLAFALDLFQGKDAALSLNFKDQSSRQLPIVSDDLDKVSKIAVVWRAPVNLDLHAFEYTAKAGQKGHVWAGSTSDADGAASLAKAETRGHGFLSSVATAAGGGDKAEVYTFWHVPGQDGGAITLAVDYETRGSMPKAAACGAGALAAIEMQVFRLVRGSAPESETRVLAAAPCDTALAEEARYNPDSMPHLRVK